MEVSLPFTIRCFQYCATSVSSYCFGNSIESFPFLNTSLLPFTQPFQSYLYSPMYSAIIQGFESNVN